MKNNFIAFLILSLFISSCKDTAKMPSTVMEGNIMYGDVVEICRPNNLKKGDIIIFNNYCEGANWIYRIIAESGDRLLIQDDKVFVNDNPVEISNLKFKYYATFSSHKPPPGLDTLEHTYSRLANMYFLYLTESQLKEVKKINTLEQIERVSYKHERILPGDSTWTIQDYGPIYIPEIGDTISGLYSLLGRFDFSLYSLFKCGKLNTKILEEKVYFVLGDNRHNSVDSRFIGFIPESAISGKVCKD
ncbi:MAG: hypothetical protein EA412_01960 [Chitinophagaceae bacterium]|nr:MAG: hypothetical protein EA412_01960 [Chitinophagaceae bacterium]